MLEFKVDREESVALHDQVAAEIRKAIADGEAVAGETLPSSKYLATVLGVNQNTVLRALRILRDEGIVDFTRGRGVKVTGSPSKGAVIMKLTELLAFARVNGYKRSDIISLIESMP
jgi:GntR family transcriptional regulator